MTTILNMIDRHAELNRQLDRMYEAGGDAAADSPEYRAIAGEAMSLEPRIIATLATCPADAAAKRAFIDSLDDIDLDQLIGAVLDLDAQQVAAAA